MAQICISAVPHLFCNMRRVNPERLPLSTYRELYNLARLCRAHGWKSNGDGVTQAVREILGSSSIRDSFAGWADKKVAAYFYDHFVRQKCLHESSMHKQLRLIRACGASDEGSADLLEKERAKGLGSFLEERVVRPAKRARTFCSRETQTEAVEIRSIPAESEVSELDDGVEDPLSAGHTGLSLQDENVDLSSSEQHPAGALE